MRPSLAYVWELLLLVVLVQATSNATIDDKHVCIRKELREHKRTTEIPMKRSDAENCVDPSSCTRRIQRNRLRWFNVSRCCPGYKPTPHPKKELVCVPACPDGCPEFATCHSRGACVCKSGLHRVSRTPLVCVDPMSMLETTTNATTRESVTSSASSPSPTLTTSDGNDGPDASWRPATHEELESSPRPSPDYTGFFENYIPGFFRQEMEGVGMTSTAFTPLGGPFSIWMITLLNVLAEWN